MFELTYGKQKKHLFSTKSARSINMFDKQEKNEDDVNK